MSVPGGLAKLWHTRVSGCCSAGVRAGPPEAGPASLPPRVIPGDKEWGSTGCILVIDLCDILGQARLKETENISGCQGDGGRVCCKGT